MAQLTQDSTIDEIDTEVRRQQDDSSQEQGKFKESTTIPSYSSLIFACLSSEQQSCFIGAYHTRSIRYGIHERKISLLCLEIFMNNV
jgi:hypothetical protein